MNLARILVLASAVCVLYATAFAQGFPGDRYFDRLKYHEAKVAALAPDALDRDSHPLPEVMSAQLAYDNLGISRSWIGDVDGAIATFDQLNRSRFPVRASEASQLGGLTDAAAEDAIKAIVEQARTRRVVLLNEAHHVPMHRAFAQKLAAELRKSGYEYLACETFSGAGEVPLGVHGEVTFRTGTYTPDPVFAGFVNSALADKWKLVSYEMQGRPSSRDERERVQAQNLVERIFNKDPHAKVFIYVGYSHLNKVPEGANESVVFMGEYLRRLTGLDMLHVQQIDFYSHPERADEGDLYQALLDKFPSREPFVLRSKNGGHPILRGLSGRVDMQVIFPRYAKRDGRPEWLTTLAGRQARPIPDGLLPRTGRRLIKAFRSTDGPDAVPADIVLVEAGHPIPKLMLPNGEYRFTYED